MGYATCSVSTEHTEQQSNRATEHSAGHVTQRSAVLAAGRDERRRYLTFCLRPYHTTDEFDDLRALFFRNGLMFALYMSLQIGRVDSELVSLVYNYLEF